MFKKLTGGTEQGKIKIRKTKGNQEQNQIASEALTYHKLHYM